MNVKAIGKFLDQPILISKLKNQTPKLLAGAALAYGTYDTFKAPKEERKNRGIKNAVILSTVVGTSLISAFGLKMGKTQVFQGLVNVKNPADILNNNSQAVDKFLKNNNINEKAKTVLNRSKEGMLSLNDTKEVLKLKNSSNQGADELLDTLFSKKEDLNAKEIFKETGRLSILGLMPVAGGVLGGIAAEKITGENTPKSTSDKIKEGTYQFLANIFMCNVGAAGALFAAEKLQKAGTIKALSPMGKLGVIMGGIFITGIMGGSIAANWLGKHILDPIFDKKHKEKEGKPADEANFRRHVKHGRHKDIYSERKPELLDMALHTDDIATAGVLSGFKWIEPMLPLMYTISGYRAGIGYRNNEP